MVCLSELQSEPEVSAAEAWHRLIEAICLREKRINEHLEASAIRNILGALADVARDTVSGRGPLFPSDVARAYSHATGYDEPDEHIRPLLMRLPGLTSRSSEDGSREFLDDSMLNALRASGIVNFFRSPFETDPQARNWRHGLSDLGIDVAIHALSPSAGADTKSIVAARQAYEKWQSPTLAADLIRLGQNLTLTGSELSCSLQITGGVFEELDLSDVGCSDLILAECEIRVLVVPPGDPSGCHLQDCIIDKIVGIPKPELVPAWIQKSEIGEYDLVPTNASIIDDVQLSAAHRVLLTIVRKLFLQRGAGRRENALLRGLPNSFKTLVPQILEIMRSKGFVSMQVSGGNRVWRPDRSRTAEVHAILTKYSASKHVLVEEVRLLDSNRTPAGQAGTAI